MVKISKPSGIAEGEPTTEECRQQPEAPIKPKEIKTGGFVHMGTDLSEASGPGGSGTTLRRKHHLLFCFLGRWRSEVTLMSKFRVRS